MVESLRFWYLFILILSLNCELIIVRVVWCILVFRWIDTVWKSAVWDAESGQCWAWICEAAGCWCRCRFCHCHFHCKINKTLTVWNVKCDTCLFIIVGCKNDSEWRRRCIDSCLGMLRSFPLLYYNTTSTWLLSGQ